MGPELTIVVPTYNEADSLPHLVAQLREVLPASAYEILVVDDDSPDGTARVAQAMGSDVRVIVRRDERGLATAVVRGIQDARGDLVAVMDADLQHPPAAMAKMLERARDTGADLLVGTRYRDGGSEGDFGPVRRLISRGAALVAKVALPPVRQHGITDPMSGLFMVRRDRIDASVLRPQGYKILLEILGRATLDHVEEVGYEFQTREHGDSKLGSAVMLQYLLHVANLAWHHPENRRVVRFGLVGLSGVIVNLGLLFLLTQYGRLYDLLAVPIAIEASIISNFLLNDAFTFHDRREGHRLARLARFNAVSLVALAVNLSTYTLLTRGLHIHYLVAEGLAIIVAFGANYAGNLQWTYGGRTRFRLRQTLRKGVAWLPFVFVVAAATTSYFNDLDDVEGMYFDEGYYVSVAYQIKNGIWEDPCWENSELDHRPLNYEHPPLAKLIIAWSVTEFGDYGGVFKGCRDKTTMTYDNFRADLEYYENPVVWRAPSAVFGAITVLFTGLVAARFWGPTGAFLASAFVAVDGMVYTASRMATLDIFAAGFLMVALFLATFPKKWGLAGSAVALALGFASKYYVAFFGPAVLLLAWYVRREASDAPTRRWIASAAAIYVAVAVGVWLAAYAPWWRLWIPQMGVVGALGHFADITEAALRRMAAAQQDHPYISPPAEWLSLRRPMLFFIDDRVHDDIATTRRIYGLGNPLVWWGAVAAALAAWLRPVWLTIRPGGGRGDLPRWWRGLTSNERALRMLSLVPLLGYAVFFVLTRSTFIFYMTVLVPPMAVLLGGYAAHRLDRAGGVWVGPLLVGAFSLYLEYWPVLHGDELTMDAFQRLMDIVPWMRA